MAIAGVQIWPSQFRLGACLPPSLPFFFPFFWVYGGEDSHLPQWICKDQRIIFRSQLSSSALLGQCLSWSVYSRPANPLSSVWISCLCLLSHHRNSRITGVCFCLWLIFMWVLKIDPYARKTSHSVYVLSVGNVRNKLNACSILLKGHCWLLVF